MIADYDELEMDDATQNFIIRATTITASLVSSRQLDKSKIDKAVQLFIELGIDEGINQIKENLLNKPEQE